MRKRKVASPEAQARWRDFGRIGGARMARINLEALKQHRKADGIDRDDINFALDVIDRVVARLNRRTKPDAQD